MNPRIIANQERTFRQFFAQIRPHVATDSALPRRIKELLGRNRAIGSRDRRLYRELIYTALRYLPWFERVLARDEAAAGPLVAWLAPDLPDTRPFREALLAGWPATPSTLAEQAAVLQTRFGGGTGAAGADFAPAALLPDWLRAECPAAFSPPHLDALNRRADLWVRLQVSDPELVLGEFRGKHWTIRRPSFPPDAVALPPAAAVAASDAYRRGFCEIQDLGSQLVLHHVPDPSGQTWLDACAGAGGKTLQLARLVGDRGRVDATDIRPQALAELQERADRGRFGNITVLGPAPRPGAYDGVLVDAPCSGTGTWRRLPHMKWYTQPGMLAAFARDQLAILRAHAPSVRPGGLLVYATCSLAHQENGAVVEAFLAAESGFQPEAPARELGGTPDGAGRTLLPGTLDTDGFHVCLLRRVR